MQTFVPRGIDLVTAFGEMDYRRLGKQRVEAKQIILALTEDDYGWKNHPAVRMWDGYVGGLACYGWLCCTAWIDRGYNDSLLPFFDDWCGREPIAFPAWLDDDRVAYTHRSALVRKDPGYYVPLYGDLPHVDYLWPVSA